MRPSALIVDHDDTAVDSTAHVHYPAHLETMRRLRPEREPVSLDGWFLKNFDPGIMHFLTGELGFTEAEIAEEFSIWQSYTRTRSPRFFPGFIEVLDRFRVSGGRVAVVSHSEEETIRDHYGSTGFQPDMVLGWDDDARRRKPSTWPLEQVLDRWALTPDQALVIDDLRPGVVMAREARVPVAAAGWAHHIPAIEAYMRAHCDHYFGTVAELAHHLFGAA